MPVTMETHRSLTCSLVELYSQSDKSRQSGRLKSTAACEGHRLRHTFRENKRATCTSPSLPQTPLTVKDHRIQNHRRPFLLVLHKENGNMWKRLLTGNALRWAFCWSCQVSAERERSRMFNTDNFTSTVRPCSCCEPIIHRFKPDVHPSLYLSFCLSIHLSIHLSVHPSIPLQ